MGEYFMLIFWIAFFVVLSVIEIATAQLVTIWFAVGALGALFAEVLGCPIFLQWIVFVVVSAIALIATRPLVRKYVKKSAQPTNADRCIGEIAVVEETIDNIAGKGCAKVNGVAWTARSVDGSVIENGEKVRIVKIEGVKLMVEKII